MKATRQSGFRRQGDHERFGFRFAQRHRRLALATSSHEEAPLISRHRGRTQGVAPPTRQVAVDIPDEISAVDPLAPVVVHLVEKNERRVERINEGESGTHIFLTQTDKPVARSD